MQRAFEEAEAQRDQSYEEFLLRYGDMIDGKGKSGKGGKDGDFDDKSTHSRPVTGHPDNEEGKSNDGGASEKRRGKASGSAMSKHSKSGANSMANTKEGFDVKDDLLKYELPESCFLILMKGTKISKLDKKYKLLTHPYPLIERDDPLPTTKTRSIR